MRKLKVFLLVFGLMVGIVLISPANQTNAATWHRGTPTAIRGEWLSTIPRKKDPAAGFAPFYTISKTKMDFTQSNMSDLIASNLSWRWSNHIYYVKAYTRVLGYSSGEHYTFAFYKSGLYTMYEGATAHRLKNGYAFKKMAKSRAWY